AARSRLLHRLRLLGVDWGTAARTPGGTGTFRETWWLRWEPELAVRVAEAGGWGTTVTSAATAKAEADAVAARTLAEVTALAEHCLLAGLTDALPAVMRALADRAALDRDVGHLAQALPALVRSLRYGDVRGTDTGALAEVAAGLALRICVGLPAACTGLDTEAANEMRGHVDAVHGAVALLAENERESEWESTGEEGRSAPDTPAPHSVGLDTRWRGVLRGLAARDTVAAVIRGRAARLLLDGGDAGPEEAARWMGLALSPGTAPKEAADWVEGFVGGGAGGGLLLVHDERLLAIVDNWLTAVPEEAFVDVLPLLRRTFSAFEPAVRRTLGEVVRRGSAAGRGTRVTGFAEELDAGRAQAIVPVARLLLGV
ncbi:DUF5682 family protein, partial [Streptomyces sp. S6]